MTSEKQLEANAANSSLGGVKTEEGKAVSKYNAQKHAILRQTVTEYESDMFGDISGELTSHYQPANLAEQVLVERIAIHYIKLYRLQKAESEYIKSQLEPSVTHTEGGWPELDLERVVVDKEGYAPKITVENIETISNIYGRYETAIENKLYRAIHELERLQRLRKGDSVPAPIAVDVEMGSFGNPGANYA